MSSCSDATGQRLWRSARSSAEQIAVIAGIHTEGCDTDEAKTFIINRDYIDCCGLVMDFGRFE